MAADADSDFYDDFLEKLVIRTNAAPILQGVIPDGIEMTTRETEKGCYYIYQNFGTTDLPIPMPEGELRTVYGNPSEKLPVYGLTIVYQKSDDCVKIIDKQKELSGRNHKSMVRYLCNRN